MSYWHKQLAKAAVGTLLCPPSLAQNLTVDRLDDEPGADICSDFIAADCSLRGALAFAEQVPGDQSIRLPSGTYLLNSELALTLPDRGSTTIEGEGAETTTVVANVGFRVMRIETGDVTLRGFTMTGGDVRNTDIDVGGGLFIGSLPGANVLLEDMVVSENASLARTGAGIFAGSGLTVRRSNISNNNGGGIQSLGFATIEDSVITENDGFGVAYENNGEVVRSIISSNQGRGVIAAFRVTVEDSFIDSNISASRDGGGIRASVATIRRTTISRNTAPNGAGVFIELPLGSFDSLIENSTISSNSVPLTGRGAAVSVSSGVVLTMNHVTIARNTAFGGAAIDNEGRIVASNSILSATNNVCRGSPLVTAGGNIDSSTSCRLDLEVGDIENISLAELALLQLGDNGGIAPTHLLGAQSVALEHGQTLNCADRDQLGNPRDALRCDAGALQLSMMRPEFLFGDGFESQNHQ
ncbi:MAG: right-handed parallel beta-helix repeat-containing protein [Pseudomonadota bacterium]